MGFKGVKPNNSFLTKQSRLYPQDFSDEEMARDWTLTERDIREINKFNKPYRTLIAVQIITVRLSGRLLDEVSIVSPKIINYLNIQLGLPPSISISLPEREVTYHLQRKKVLEYLGFRKFSKEIQRKLESWLLKLSLKGDLPDELLPKSKSYLLSKRIILPGSSVLERLIASVSITAFEKVFKKIYLEISPRLKKSIDDFLEIPSNQQRSYFYKLREYPPSAKVSSLKKYLKRYEVLEASGIDKIQEELVDSKLLNYLYKLAKSYSAKIIRRFKEHKRYTLMVAFMLESRKTLLDHLVKMHDQYLTDMIRHSRNIHEQKHRKLRKRQKYAIDTILDATNIVLNWPKDQSLQLDVLWRKVGRNNLQDSLKNLYKFKMLEERGYGDLMIARYPNLRKYFANFINLPFAVEPGSEPLMNAIEIIRKLDSGKLTAIPINAPTSFIPKELMNQLKESSGKINRNAWELGLALAMKTALRSGDLFIPQSKHHVSFWDLILSDSNWLKNKDEFFKELNQPIKGQSKAALIQKFSESIEEAKQDFVDNDYVEIENGKLVLKRDQALVHLSVSNLQKAIDGSMPTIRIEQLLMEVDKETGFSQHFAPISKHGSRPEHFYTTLIAAIISQATNLGVMAMSACIKDISVDKIRYLLQHYIREDTLKNASAEIVNQHHKLPLSSVHGEGSISSSDAQRFKIRADSLLASYYPRYYGYYEKAFGIYTHISDQYSVFSTKVISCSPREALYVLDGLLENNTVLKIKEHTTDTHGYTEIIFALCHLLGFYFMPRIRDIKDQQLYRIGKNKDNGVFSPLLKKTIDMDLIEEQWDSMVHVAISLKKKTAPAHIIVQRLTNSFPSDRLSKAFTNLGRIIKTEYILRYITDPELRKTVRLQLNKGEYRHKLPRWIFFANQGEFSTGDYEEIMNKASCLSLVSNAILYWNTIKISEIIEQLRGGGEVIDDETLSHISLLPFKHVIPNGTYFIEDN